MNFLFLTYDSCRYDVMLDAHTPALDSVGQVMLAQAPGNFTFASHQAFFVGILPSIKEDVPYYNRFRKQLVGLAEIGETEVVKHALKQVRSSWNLLTGLRDEGFQTVGAGAMNWFRQESLTSGFEKFLFTGTNAKRQIDFVLKTVDPGRPFFAFINFGETHAPFTFEGKKETCPVDVRARVMRWPPVETRPVGRESPAYDHQVECVEFLDAQLPRLFEGLPRETAVVLCADHGECFGEDGYWGHGVNHPRVLEVPLAVFRIDGQPLP